MNKLLQASLVATLLGAASTAVLAEDADRGGDKWSNCTSLGCQKDIPIKLNVPKKCEIKGGSPIVLSHEGGNKSSGYTITTNTPYVLNLETENAGTNPTTYVKLMADSTTYKVFTSITTNKVGSPGAIPWGNTNHDGVSTDSYNVIVNNPAVSASQRSGDYTDTYKIKVFY